MSTAFSSSRSLSRDCASGRLRRFAIRPPCCRDAGFGGIRNCDAIRRSRNYIAIRTDEGSPLISLRMLIATAVIGTGSLLADGKTARAEYDVNSALQAYDSADSANRKIWELVFGNTENGINAANSVLLYRKQQPLYCPPDNFAPNGHEALEMLRELASNPKTANLPYGFALLVALQSKYPCPN